MQLSVAYTFEPGIIARLAQHPQVREIYGKLDRDIIGGGRSTYTLRPTSGGRLRAAIAEAHRHGIAFNYLVNASTLDGTEQTRRGQARIRRFLDRLDELGVDAVTLASPLLLKVVKRVHPRLKVRVSAFACVDSPEKARQWQDLGADTLCLSAIACNRDFRTLAAIRAATTCGLQLIVNASCLPHCCHELTHMNLLTQSSRSGHALGGFCLDYCFLHCSQQRLRRPEYYLRSVWIRPEDTPVYEQMGYTNFKIVERSCPADLLLRRVAAYAARRFDGNLMELVAPVAQVKRELGQSLTQRLRMLATLARPWYARLSSLRLLQRYAEQAMPHDFSEQGSTVFIDNRQLDGFLGGLRQHDCSHTDCDRCAYCRDWATRTVRVRESFRLQQLDMGSRLEEGLASGSLWG